MTAATSLLDFILNLLKDPQAQAEFRASPEHVLAANGLTGVSAADIRGTLPLVTDNRYVELNSSNHLASPPVIPPGGDGGMHAVIHYLHHITRTYRYDDHGTHGPGHGNIWAVGDGTKNFGGGHGVMDGPAPGPRDGHRAGHWMGDDHEHSGHDSRFGYGDPTHGLSHGDMQDGPAGNTPSSRFAYSDHDHGLHSFGSGAATTSVGGVGGPAAYSGDTGGSHDGAGFHPADFGGPASQAGQDDVHTHDAHGGFGDAYYGQDSYYGQGTEHSIHDPPEPHIYLDLH